MTAVAGDEVPTLEDLIAKVRQVHHEAEHEEKFREELCEWLDGYFGDDE